ncbi:MAG: DUF6062 family protein [Gallintestinimicrobium sp.]
MDGEFRHFRPQKQSMGEAAQNCTEKLRGRRVQKKESTCYICDRFQKEYERYLTLFSIYMKDPDFKHGLQSKGFCLHHFGELCGSADTRLSEKEKETFFPEIFEIMQKNMERMSADVDWLIEKFDYQNKDADWKNSKDAIQRGMQNIRGGYPADPVYKMNK